MADKVWNATTGTWDTTANWSPNGAPTSNDQVFITNPGANVTYVNNNASITFPALYLGAGGAAGASVSQSQYTLNVDQEYIGDQDKGSYTQTGGTHNVTGNIGMTVGGAGTGSYTLSGSGALNVRNLLTVGGLGHGDVYDERRRSDFEFGRGFFAGGGGGIEYRCDRRVYAEHGDAEYGRSAACALRR